MGHEARHLRTRGPEGRKLLLGLSTALFVFAAIVGTQPWWTGAITWWQQRQLAGEFERPHPARQASTASADETTRGPSVWDGWADEDIRYWRELPEGRTFARLRIPKMHLNVLVVKGTSKADLVKGPGWITGTDLPGPTGNTVISGHRTTYLAPFRQLNVLGPGDEILLESPYRVYRYKVERVFIVRPLDRAVLQMTKQPTLTLTACHPPYSAKYRLIVRARLAGVTMNATPRSRLPR